MAIGGDGYTLIEGKPTNESILTMTHEDGGEAIIAALDDGSFVAAQHSPGNLPEWEVALMKEERDARRWVVGLEESGWSRNEGGLELR